MALLLTLAVLTAAGIGMCLAMGLRPGSVPGWAAFVGLGYLTGLSSFMIAGQFVLVIGLPPWLALIALASVPFAVGGLRMPTRPVPRRWAMPDRVAIALFTLVIVILIGLGTATALENPLFAWDGWAIWAQKAVMLRDGITAQFTNPDYLYMHPDYPVGLPALQATVYVIAGGVATTEGDLPIWLMLPAFGLSIGFLSPVRPAYWVPVTGSLLVLPFMVSGSLTNYADAPAAMLLGLGLLVGGRWLSEKSGWQVWLCGILLGGAICTKNEGVIIGFILLAAITAMGWKERRKLIPAWLVVLAAFLPWRIWMTVEGVSSDLQVGKLLDPAYLISNLDRVWTSAGRLLEESLLGLQGIELALWIIFLLAALALLLTGWRSYGTRLALIGVLGSFGALVLAYWLSPYDLEWHLTTSADRVIIGPVVLTAVGALLAVRDALANRAQTE